MQSLSSAYTECEVQREVDIEYLIKMMNDLERSTKNIFTEVEKFSPAKNENRKADRD